MNDRFEERKRMVEDQIRRRGISDERVLEAFMKVKRHAFLPEENDPEGYKDYPLSIGRGQTISQPYIVAFMTEALGLTGREKVLEIGTGSGYQTAILAELAESVFTVERDVKLLDRAEKTLFKEGYANISFKCDDGTNGWETEAPFDRVIVTAASPDVPKPLAEQLGPAGSMIIPVGNMFSQKLLRLVNSKGKVLYKELCDCVFVPLVGEHGWKE